MVLRGRRIWYSSDGYLIWEYMVDRAAMKITLWSLNTNEASDRVPRWWIDLHNCNQDIGWRGGIKQFGFDHGHCLLSLTCYESGHMASQRLSITLCLTWLSIFMKTELTISDQPSKFFWDMWQRGSTQFCVYTASLIHALGYVVLQMFNGLVTVLWYFSTTIFAALYYFGTVLSKLLWRSVQQHEK